VLSGYKARSISAKKISRVGDVKDYGSNGRVPGLGLVGKTDLQGWCAVPASIHSAAKVPNQRTATKSSGSFDWAWRPTCSEPTTTNDPSCVYFFFSRTRTFTSPEARLFIPRAFVISRTSLRP